MIADCSSFFPRIFLYFAAFNLPSTMSSNRGPTAEKHSHDTGTTTLYSGCSVFLLVSSDWLLPNIEDKKFQISFAYVMTQNHPWLFYLSTDFLCTCPSFVCKVSPIYALAEFPHPPGGLLHWLL